MTDRGLEYEIIPYLNGEELVAGYKNHPYDLIFLDVMMNEIDGIETGKMIRQMDGNVEIVYCTSSSDFAKQRMMYMLWDTCLNHTNREG